MKTNSTGGNKLGRIAKGKIAIAGGIDREKKELETGLKAELKAKANTSANTSENKKANTKGIFRLAVLGVSLSLLASSVLFSESKSDRIVALSGGVTELVYALGDGDKVVATDVSSLYPPSVNALPKLGFHARISSEAILRFKPSLVIGADSSGPKGAIDQIKSAGVRVEIVPDEWTVNGIQSRIRAIGKILGKETKAEELIRTMNADLAATKQLVLKAKSKPKALFIYARGPGVLMAAGNETVAETLFNLAGAENAAGSVSGFRPLTAEWVASSDADVIVMLTTSISSIGGRDGVLNLPGVGLTKAGKNKRIIEIEDSLFSNCTHRLGQAAKDLALKFHSELK